jgi:hypothetical protein
MVLADEMSKSMPFYRMVSIPAVRGLQPYLQFVDELFVCDMDDAPEYKWKNASGTNIPWPKSFIW